MALFTAIVVTLAAGQMFAPTGKQKFEVSTIRGSKPGAQEGAVRPAPGGRRYIGTAVPLRVYLWTAYQVRRPAEAAMPNQYVSFWAFTNTMGTLP